MNRRPRSGSGKDVPKLFHMCYDCPMSELTYFLKSRKKANLTIVIINIIIYIVLEIMGDPEESSFMLRCGACYLPAVESGQYWRLFTSMFLHFGFMHLAYNMLSLIFLGDILETRVGALRYLIIYFLGGLCGGLLSLKVSQITGDYAVSAGASGAIFAVIGSLFYIALRNRRQFGERSMKKMVLMIVLMIMQGMVDKGVDGNAHLGGLIGGFVLGILLYHKERGKYHERL